MAQYCGRISGGRSTEEEAHLFDPASLYNEVASSVDLRSTSDTSEAFAQVSPMSPTKPFVQRRSSSDDNHSSSPYISRDRPPPSSFVFPFQTHTGNPDPGMPIPGSRRNSWGSPLGLSSRRSSNESIQMLSRSPTSPLAQSAAIYNDSRNSTVHGYEYEADFIPPAAPFMRNVTRNSSNGSITVPPNMLSPASRPQSSVWSYNPDISSSQGSHTDLNAPQLRTRASTMLDHPLEKKEKPWLRREKSLRKEPSTPDANIAVNSLVALSPQDVDSIIKNKRQEKWAYWLTVFFFLLGVGLGGFICWRGVNTLPILDDSDLCQIMDETWGGGISNDSWIHDAGYTGWGNGEFQVYSADDSISYTSGGELYILPTLMSNVAGGKDKIFNGGSYHVNDCSFAETNVSACDVSSSSNSSTVLPPVISARLTTKGRINIDGGKGGGKIEVVAKMPTGDWLWPAIWLLPEDENYGPWPLSGEIDIVESRGNDLTYGGQGSNFVRSSINYGPMDGLVTKIFGWWQMKRGGFNKDFHTYTLEWEADTSSGSKFSGGIGGGVKGGWMRFSVDSKVRSMLTLTGINDGKGSFFERGDYPATTVNSSTGTEVAVPDIWSGRSGMAPFDQKFYLILSVAAGGTSGWFPDGVSNKPWVDSNISAIVDYALAQDTWETTWPQSDSDRAMRVSSVKIWQKGGC